MRMMKRVLVLGFFCGTGMAAGYTCQPRFYRNDGSDTSSADPQSFTAARDSSVSVIDFDRRGKRDAWVEGHAGQGSGLACSRPVGRRHLLVESAQAADTVLRGAWTAQTNSLSSGRMNISGGDGDAVPR